MKTKKSSILQPLACCLLAAGIAGLLAGCGWDGHFNLLGYSTKPNYDTTIKTVYVPIFKNQTFYRGMEFDLTRAVIREIESKTPYKTSSSPVSADSELLGKIKSVVKSVINQNQLGEVRQAQLVMTVEIVWRDLRPGHVGEILSAQRQGGTGPPKPGDPPPPPVLVTSMGQFETELGGSLSTAQQQAFNTMAVQIISMMEIWPSGPPMPAASP